MRTPLDRNERFAAAGVSSLSPLDGIMALGCPPTGGTNTNINYGSSSTFDSINVATMGIWIMRASAAKDLGLFAHGILASNNRRTWSCEHGTRGAKMQMVVDRATNDSFFISAESSISPNEWGAVFCRYSITNAAGDFCEFYEYTFRGGFRPIALDPAASGYNVGSGAVQASTGVNQNVGNYGNANSDTAGLGGIGPHFMASAILPLSVLEEWAQRVSIEVLRGYPVLIHARPHRLFVVNEAIGKPSGAPANWTAGGIIPGLDPWRRLRYVVQPRRYATAAGALAALTASGTARVRVLATGASSLGALTSAGTALALGRATGAGSLASLTASASARIIVTANGAVSLAALTAAGTGTSGHVATATGALAALTATGSGRVLVAALASASLASLTSAASARVLDLASGAGTLGALTVSGAAAALIVASGAGTLAALAGVGSGATIAAGSGSPSLGALVGSGSGTTLVRAIGAASLGALVGAGAGTVVTLASIGVGVGALGALTAAGVARTLVLANGAAALAALVGVGTGSAGISVLVAKRAVASIVASVRASIAISNSANANVAVALSARARALVGASRAGVVAVTSRIRARLSINDTTRPD